MTMDPRSESILAHVHPDLVKVVRQAWANTHQPFEVIAGLRTVAQEAVNVAKGASQTMHSRHLPNAQGLACAVDVAALVNGHIDWSAQPYFGVDVAIQAASKALNIPIEWGGDWKTLKDYGHFQLSWKDYP